MSGNGGKTGLKNGIKTAKSPKGGAELPLGAHPGNTGGKKGRSGRKSKQFLARCIEAIEDEKLWAAARKRTPFSVLALAASYAQGKPPDRVELTGKDGGPLEVEHLDDLRERLARRIAGVAARLGTPGTLGGTHGNGTGGA